MVVVVVVVVAIVVVTAETLIAQMLRNKKCGVISFGVHGLAVVARVVKEIAKGISSIRRRRGRLHPCWHGQINFR